MGPGGVRRGSWGFLPVPAPAPLQCGGENPQTPGHIQDWRPENGPSITRPSMLLSTSLKRSRLRSTGAFSLDPVIYQNLLTSGHWPHPYYYHHIHELNTEWVVLTTSWHYVPQLRTQGVHNGPDGQHPHHHHRLSTPGYGAAGPGSTMCTPQ